MSETIRQQQLPGSQNLLINRGDITLEEVDAIVNAANSGLQHGGGVAAAISSRGGPAIQRESNAWIAEHGLVSHTSPAYTGGGKLPCRYVIHAVGPVWGEGREDEKLAAAVAGSLALADELELDTLALPAISTGIFGFPKERAAQVILSTIRGYFEEHPESGLKQIRLTLYDSPTVDAFVQVWDSADSQ